MREIKFRAWDKKRQAMFNWEKVRQWTFDQVNNPKAYDEDINFMQYTGLKDCKGNEIYEGDIVEERNISDGEHTRRVVFNRGCFWTEGNDGNGNLLYIPLRIKVIGNIYENKELIKETK